MRLIAFLILGTLLFGLAFPAAILFIGILIAVLFFIAVVRLLTGGLRGGSFTVYTNRGSGSPFENGSETRRSAAGDPEAADVSPRYEEESDVMNFGEDAEGEIVELPATALRKDDEETG